MNNIFVEGIWGKNPPWPYPFSFIFIVFARLFTKNTIQEKHRMEPIT